MSDNVYPSLDESKLRLVARIVAANPTFLTDTSCPYSEEVKALFAPKVTVVEEGNYDLPSTDDIQSKVVKLVEELEAFGRDTSSMSSAEKNTYFRLSAGLLNTLTEMREKLSNIKQHELFVETVLSILDDVCNADQKAEFRGRLEAFQKGDQYGG